MYTKGSALGRVLFIHSAISSIPFLIFTGQKVRNMMALIFDPARF